MKYCPECRQKMYTEYATHYGKTVFIYYKCDKCQTHSISQEAMMP